MSLFILFVYLSSLVGWSVQDDVASKLHEPIDTSNWVDPQAMFPLRRNKDPSPLNAVSAGTGEACDESICEKCCRSQISHAAHRNELIMLRHVLRKFITVAKSDKGSRKYSDLLLRIEEDQLLAMDKLLDTETETAQSFKIVDKWNEVLSSLQIHHRDAQDWMESTIGWQLPLVRNMLTVIALLFAVIYYERNLKISLLPLLVYILRYALILGLIVSFPWNWYRMYQEKVAEQQSKLFDRNNQAHCEPLSAGQVLRRTVSGFFSMKPEPSPCEQYYRAINVDPFLDVPPTKVVAVTFVSFIIEPLKHIGKGIGEFIQEILSPLPFYMWPMIMLSIILFLFLFMLIQSKYQIRLPYFLMDLRPAQPNEVEHPVRNPLPRVEASAPLLDGSTSQTPSIRFHSPGPRPVRTRAHHKQHWQIGLNRRHRSATSTRRLNESPDFAAGGDWIVEPR